MGANNQAQNSESKQGPVSHREKYLKLLQERLESPLQKRLVGAYQEKDDPVKAMELELGKVLIEILEHED
jgi:hypothetical protein